AVVLDGRLVADADVEDVAAGHGAEPDRRTGADHDVAHEDGVVGEEGALPYLGRLTLEVTQDCHAASSTRGPGPVRPRCPRAPPPGRPSSRTRCSRGRG